MLLFCQLFGPAAPDTSVCTTNGAESFHGHINVLFYYSLRPNITITGASRGTRRLTGKTSGEKTAQLMSLYSLMFSTNATFMLGLVSLENTNFRKFCIGKIEFQQLQTAQLLLELICLREGYSSFECGQFLSRTAINLLISSVASS
jgi:hypothetical protein